MNRSIIIILLVAALFQVTVASGSENCFQCHSDPELKMERNGKTISLYVDKNKFIKSAHGDFDCAACHLEVNPEKIPHFADYQRVECGSCHEEAQESYSKGSHGAALKREVKDAPDCVTCHGKHNILASTERSSKTNRMNIPSLCGECHRKKGKAVEATGRTALGVYSDYSFSVHGKGLREKGLLPSAICTDCHNSHKAIRSRDSLSPVNRLNIDSTCGRCHLGILEKLEKSIHYTVNKNDAGKYPTCSDCHSAHQISEVKRGKFIMEVRYQCGVCHAKLSETYLETIHGKAFQLGYLKAASCSNCHESHMTLAVNNSDSSVGKKNILKTCRKCHERATYKFTQYLTHATHKDKERYPALYYAYWSMTTLLLSVFGFFGLHTLLWLPRSLAHRKKLKKEVKIGRYILRFTLADRITHLFVVTSFLLLALTGMVLKFSSMPWALWLSDIMGGPAVARIIHRICAVITFGYFFYHLWGLAKKKRDKGTTWAKFIFGENSIFPNLHDVKEFWGTIKWFVGAGPRPLYGHWTYWEKFDYFAVFWGVAIIGLSGLMLWFPEQFTILFPGWVINVATIIHSEEALLATGFIFVVHFFNTHLRPESFPMDKIIFTGAIPEERLALERPSEYEELKKSGEIDKLVVEAPSEKWDKYIYIIGGAFLVIGIALALLIIYSTLAD